ncbi:MAG TPA: hypothetical protein VGM39_25870 [Kofleriaceae bacterium]|jgi:hypothetical protein
MAVSNLSFVKSETRNLADMDRLDGSSRWQTSEWSMQSSTFFIGFVVIAALLTIAALALR